MALVTDWARLQDAYGSAEEVGRLLRRTGAGEGSVWPDLWSRLCHQGTTYSASRAALPHLAELAASDDPATAVDALLLATAIVAADDGSSPGVDVRHGQGATVDLLRAAAERLLPQAHDDDDFVYRLQALLVTEGAGPWSSWLDALVVDEVELACPACHEQLLVSLGGAPSGAVFGDGSVAATAVTPADRDRLTGGEARAYDLARSLGRPEVALRLAELFGAFDCPGCGARVRASDALP